MGTVFRKLNDTWNAEPNAPDPKVRFDGDRVTLSFALNSFLFPEFRESDLGVLRFTSCSRYRLGATNDEGWYRGQCRFSKLAPRWGEFYEVSGDLLLSEAPRDWVVIGEPHETGRHFLFYLRDDTFECSAEGWSFHVHRA